MGERAEIRMYVVAGTVAQPVHDFPAYLLKRLVCLGRLPAWQWGNVWLVERSYVDRFVDDRLSR